jgi:hypothetical protein
MSKDDLRRVPRYRTPLRICRVFYSPCQRRDNLPFIEKAQASAKLRVGSDRRAVKETGGLFAIQTFNTGREISG